MNTESENTRSLVEKKLELEIFELERPIWIRPAFIAHLARRYLLSLLY